MIYRAIGVMSGSSLDGLDITFAEFHETASNWSYHIASADCYPYSKEWFEGLRNAGQLQAIDYQLLHVRYGHYIGEQVNKFIDLHHLHYQVSLIASHGHTIFHSPSQRMTAQLGDGASIAAITRLPVITDLRSIDVALGGQGAPIVPIGEKLLLKDFDLFLNLGGIANISLNKVPYVAFDVCPANRVLDMLARLSGKDYDNEGMLANSGMVDDALLNKLNALSYYQEPFPKSLANEFGTDVVFPLIRDSGCEIRDSLRTYVEHIVNQVSRAIELGKGGQSSSGRLLVTGGGVFNRFLIERLQEKLKEMDVEVVVPNEKLVKYKEAMIMAFIGVLRWRQEYNVLASVTGATRDSIGGALWTGQEA